MAAARKNVSKKPKGKDELEDPSTTRRERLTLIIYLLGGVAIIAGMVVLSEFLSQGKPDRTVLIVAGSLFGVVALGILATYLMRRNETA
jgi:UDP-N-acetylmuramyl pentapeptide phosphotransferase/UDP-N-acetylglucosamine-1-phosphate transferase